jgi:hypothetical protein
VSFYVSTATFFLLHCDEWEKLTEKHCNRNLPDLLYTVHLYILSKKINFQVVVSISRLLFQQHFNFLTHFTGIIEAGIGVAAIM